jgi:hypothetical protein
VPGGRASEHARSIYATGVEIRQVQLQFASVLSVLTCHRDVVQLDPTLLIT